MAADSGTHFDLQTGSAYLNLRSRPRHALPRVAYDTVRFSVALLECSRALMAQCQPALIAQPR